MRKNLKKIILLTALFLVSFCLYGKNVSIMILQNNGSDKITEASKVFENLVLNTLFDCGHIVTNEPISLIEDYDFASEKGFDAAVNGFMDYFIEIEIEYDREKSSNPDAVLLENVKSVEYVIKNVRDGSVFYKSGKMLPNLEMVSNQFVGFNKFACEIADKINLKLNGK